MAEDSDTPAFDAVAAAQELDDAMAGPVGAKNDDYVATLESEIEELNALLAEKEAARKAADARADRALAEVDTASKRLERAAQKELEHRTRKILEAFLPVLDDMGRGVEAARKHADSKDVVDGLELVRRSLLSRMGQFGVTAQAALGEVFDPNRHDALALVPVTDPAQHNRVIDVMRDGYNIGDETLRPAGVAVGKLS
ncbi:MAG TPA: nucleotide exchange factor GrpE [Kofleriaceae bacterium]